MKNEIGHYLAGLIEGDGSIYTPKEGSKNWPKIEIIFHLNDLPLALEIVKTIGKGSINKKNGKNVYILSFNSIEAIKKVINLINGKFRTPKILSLHKLIFFMNVKYNLNIPIYPLDESNIDSNSWLSGFTEADGCFMVRATENKKKISCTYTLEQRTLDMNNQSLEKIMKKIADYFEVNLNTTNRINKNNTYVIKMTSFKSLLKTKEYFTNYPLFGVKYLNYIDCMKVFNLILTKKSLNMSREDFFQNCKLLKNQMNNKRKNFDFTHLKNFY